MKKLSITTLFIFLVVVLFLGTTGYAESFKYVGIQKCGMCHKGEKKNKVFEQWQSTAHAGAYKTLLNEKSKEIAKKKGLKVPANEAEECLKCHAAGYHKNDIREASAKKEDGVTCEVCHGAASGYVLKHGKNKEDGYKNGMAKKSAEVTLCKKCHNSESPTYVAATTAKHLNSMDKIKHWK